LWKSERFIEGVYFKNWRGRFKRRILHPIVEGLEREARDAAVGKMASQITHDIRSAFADPSEESRASFDKAGGSGLGPAHAHQTIEACDGEIRIESELRRGTKVSFTLSRGAF